MEANKVCTIVYKQSVAAATDYMHCFVDNRGECPKHHENNATKARALYKKNLACGSLKSPLLHDPLLSLLESAREARVRSCTVAPASHCCRTRPFLHQGGAGLVSHLGLRSWHPSCDKHTVALFHKVDYLRTNFLLKNLTRFFRRCPMCGVTAGGGQCASG